MTAPDLPTWTVAPDADGNETLWLGDTAVLRRFEVPSVRLAAGVSYDLLWSVLTRVLAPDEDTIERLAEAMHAIDCGCSDLPSKSKYHSMAKAVLAALAGSGESE